MDNKIKVESQPRPKPTKEEIKSAQQEKLKAIKAREIIKK